MSALIGVESCGCITYANSRPDHLDQNDLRAIRRILEAGGHTETVAPDEARSRPNFLPWECPHDPKGWNA